MKIKEYVDEQRENVDYCNINLARDTKLYVDPLFIQFISEKSEDSTEKNLALKANKQIDAFFSEIVRIHNECPSNEKNKAFSDLFKYFKEPQDLRLGLSTPGNSGKGTTKEEMVRLINTREVANLFNHGKTIQPKFFSGLITSFGDDKLSDLISNIIMNVIVEFNELMYEKYSYFRKYQGADKQIYNYFCAESKQWNAKHFSPLVIDGKKLLLVPVKFLSINQTTNLTRLLYNYVEQPILSLTVHLPNGKIKKPTKKDFIKDQSNGQRKAFGKNLVLSADGKYHKMYKQKIFTYIKKKLEDN